MVLSGALPCFMVTLSNYCINQFGEKLYKLCLTTGCTCPNRDGTLGSSGCIFCSQGGSGEFSGDASLSVSEQIENEKKRVSSKFHGKRYIAYFQSFTNTYGPVEKLEDLFIEAANRDDIAVVSIATRPDCLGPEVLSMLQRINSIKPVWVELGLQTIHPETAAYIRRGYDLCVFDEAVTNLSVIGIHVIVHLILGLPGESEEDMLESVRYVASGKANGIKLQLLQVLEGTDLAEEWRKGSVPEMSLPEYAALIVRCVSILPENMVVHRLTGDGAKRLLLAPLWCADKKNVLNTIHTALKNASLLL